MFLLFQFDEFSGLYRRVNVLLYLNKDWDEQWYDPNPLISRNIDLTNQFPKICLACRQGHLELWNANVTKCVQRIPPSFNRMVNFVLSFCKGSLILDYRYSTSRSCLRRRMMPFTVILSLWHLLRVGCGMDCSWCTTQNNLLRKRSATPIARAASALTLRHTLLYFSLLAPLKTNCGRYASQSSDLLMTTDTANAILDEEVGLSVE